MTKNANCAPNLVVLEQKFKFYWRKQKFWYEYNRKKHFGTLFALFFWLGMGRNRPKMIIFGPKLPKTHILGKIWPFMGVSKSFGTHITKKHLGNLFALIFWSGIGSYGPKMPIYDQKCQFWAQLGRLEAKNQFLGMEKNFWYPHIRKPMRHLFRVENIDRYGSYWPQGTKMCNFDPKI